MRFDGKSGMKPSAEARRYVLSSLANFLEDDILHGDPDKPDRVAGWMLGPLDQPSEEPDRRRVRKEAMKIIKSLRRQAAKKPRAR